MSHHTEITYFERNFLQRNQLFHCFPAVGCLKDGELHVTPLKGILQLRPSFVYLDRGDSKQESTGAGGDDSQDEEEEAKPITVR